MDPFPQPGQWDNLGPMARSVTDLAILLQYMTGFDPKDPSSIQVNTSNYTENLNEGIAGLQIGIPVYYLENLDSEVEALFKQAVNTLEELGAHIKEVHIPELAMSTFAGLATMSGEASAFHYDWLQTQTENYGADIRAFLQTGILSSTAQYLKAQQARRKLTDAFHTAFQDVDILIAPTIPITAPAFKENWVKQNLEVESRCVPFTAPTNLTGLPNLSVPMGLSSNGLPAGMQLIGDHLSENLLLRAGRAWEQTDPLRVQLKN